MTLASPVVCREHCRWNIRLMSSIVGQEYRLDIMLPETYEARDQTSTYPTVYLFDSHWDFDLVASIYRQQVYDGFIPELIIVGVTHGGANPDHEALRVRDYTPFKVDFAQDSGAASRFLRCVKEELVPFVERNYRADPSSRTLVASSMSGLFALSCLFSDSDLFNGYVVSCPILELGGGDIYKFEQAYSDRTSAVRARLYMAKGALDRGLDGFERFARHMERRNYGSLKMKTRILDNMGHAGSKSEAFSRGLQYVFEKPSLKLEREWLARYVGLFATSSGERICLKEEGGVLVCVLAEMRYVLHAATESIFHANGEKLTLSFSVADGRATRVSLARPGNTQAATRIDPD